MKLLKPYVISFDRWSFRVLAVILVSLSMIGVGVYGFWERYRTTNAVQAEIIPIEEVQVAIDEPDETPIERACATYTVPGKEPRTLTLPGKSEASCIQKIGVDQTNAIAVPSNVNLVGWYTKSVLPGEKGISVLVGHVQGKYVPGVFHDLRTMKQGQEIKLERGDGTMLVYRVIDMVSYPVDKVMGAVYEQVPLVESQLSLITCGGAYDEKTETYAERILVRASLL